MRDQAEGLRRELRGSHTPILAITGGKGGVGKSVIAVNLALLAAESGQRTLLVDLDPGTANLHVHLRESGQRTIDDALSGACSPRAACTTVGPRLHAMFGTSGPSPWLENEPESAKHALRVVREASKHFDLVICDTGSGVGHTVVEAVRNADLSLAVTAPDPASATDTYALMKVLHARGLEAPRLVVNRVHDVDEAVRTATRLNTASQRFLDRSCELLGWVHHDAAIDRSVRAQEPICRSRGGKRTQAAQDLQSLFTRSKGCLGSMAVSDQTIG